MATKNGRQRSPEEAARREKIRELLETAGVNGMDDIQQLFRETIAEFMENGLDSPTRSKLCIPGQTFRTVSFTSCGTPANMYPTRI